MIPASANGTITTTPGIVDAGGLIWTLVNSQNVGMQVACNGTVDTLTAYVLEMEYYNGSIYQKNIVNNWYSKSASVTASWSAANAPGVSIAAAPTAVQALASDGLIDTIGVNTHFEYTGSQQYNVNCSVLSAILGASGIRHVRVGAVTSGAPSNFLSILRNLASSYGTKFSVTTNPSFGTASNQADWIISLGASNVLLVEGLNEPSDMPSALSWQQLIYKAIKGISTLNSVIVIGPSMLDPTMIQNAAQAGMGNYIDGANVHNYLGGENPETTAYNSFAQTYNDHVKPIKPNVPHYYTECGTNSNVPYLASNFNVNGVWCDEITEGIYAIRYFLAMYITPNAPLRGYKYELFDEAGSTLRESNFGMVRADFSLKPIYTAIQNLISLCSDPGPSFIPGKLNYALSGNLSNVMNVLLGKHDGNFILALWNSSPIFDNGNGAVLGLASPQTVVINVVGKSNAAIAIPNTSNQWTTAALISGAVTLSIGSMVTLVRFS